AWRGLSRPGCRRFGAGPAPRGIGPTCGSLGGSLFDRVELIHFHVLEHGRRPRVLAGPVDRDAVDLVGLAQAKCNRQLALAQVAAGARPLLSLGHAIRFETDAGADSASIGASAVSFQGQSDPVVAGTALVAQQAGWAAILGQDQVEVSVAVDVGKSAAPTD